MSQSNPLDDARKIIAKRASDPKAQMLGLASDLKAVGRALDELERRAGMCAEAWLLLYDHLRQQGSSLAPKVHDAVIASLGSMNDHAGVIARRITHGKVCTCEECLRRLRTL